MIYAWLSPVEMVCKMLLICVQLMLKRIRSFFNSTKSVSVFFKPKQFCALVSPIIYFSKNTVSFSDNIKYLGAKFNALLSDDDDIYRQVIALQVKNSLFLMLYIGKNVLFCSYSMQFYSSQLWCNSGVSNSFGAVGYNLSTSILRGTDNFSNEKVSTLNWFRIS